MVIDTVGEQQHGDILRVLLKDKEPYNMNSREAESWTTAKVNTNPGISMALEPIPGGEQNAPSWKQLTEAKRRALDHWEVGH